MPFLPFNLGAIESFLECTERETEDNELRIGDGKTNVWDICLLYETNSAIITYTKPPLPAISP
jgi:hypothetical protein